MKNSLLGGLLAATSLFISCAHADEIALSTLDLTKTNQGFGKARANLSVNGKPLSIAGQKFASGIGTHAASSLLVDLNQAATRFTALVGVDDDTNGNPKSSVQFMVKAGNKVLWESGVMKSGQSAQKVDVDVTGVQILQLIVTDAGDGIDNDHANWADAKITFAGAAPSAISPPVRPAVILTPKPAQTPRINGAPIFGVRPNSPFLYSIPATGARPMKFSAKGLPRGLKLDAATGRISGALQKKGEYQVTLSARNALGAAQKPFRIVVGETIALTPPMGWNSWNAWHANIDQDKILRSARALVAAGLDQHGWTYINIDDAWQGQRGGPLNAIQPNPQRFPDMKGLADEIHGMGLKIGIYSSPWVTTYAHRVGGSSENPQGIWDAATMVKGTPNRETLPYDMGKYSFARQDAKQWGIWGIDHMKYDWSPITLVETKWMNDALRASGRDIVFSLSNNVTQKLLDKIPAVSQHANTWRTNTDITDTWNSIRLQGFNQDKWAPYSRPGHWNDPDMFEIGANGGGKPKRLTPDEQYTHVSQWCLLAAPLLLGCDLEHLDAFTIGLLSNDEVIEINQDALGRQATRVAKDGDLEVFAKPLEDGSIAVGLYNVSAVEDATVTAKWADLGLKGGHRVRDLWRQQDLGVFADKFEATVAPHGVVLVRMFPAK